MIKSEFHMTPLNINNFSRMNKIKDSFLFSPLIIVSLICFSCQSKSANEATLQQGLVGYWKLSKDILDYSGNKLPTKEKKADNMNYEDDNDNPKERKRWIEVNASPKLQFADKDFTITAWVNLSENNVTGDILSQYDISKRKGFHLSVKTNPSPSGVANSSQLSFGIDDNISMQWEDCGRPGNALMAYGLTEYKGILYAGTCEPRLGDAGHVYRYDSSNQAWIDCGSPDQSNSVIALTEYEGKLYAGTGKYRVAGSSLPESENTTLGGRIFRLEEPNNWVDCGRLPDVESIASLVVYNGALYASSLYSPGFFKYDKNDQWLDCGVPDGKRVVSFGVFDGYLFATSYDVGNVYRYDGSEWIDCGQVGDNTQCYGFSTYQGELHVSTWRSGRVFAYEGINNWRDVGRLGNELEVMGLITHNGQLLGGTLPLAEAYVYEGDTIWRRMDQLDKTENVIYRRAWTMAEHNGKVYCSTLPSGHIYSYEAGKSVTWDKSFPAGWHHIVVSKSINSLKLYVDGELVNETMIPDSLIFNLESTAPLKIGFGQNDIFKGQIKEVRLYNRMLKEEEIESLTKRPRSIR